VNDDEPVLGEVVRWSSEEGWGVLRSDAVDGLAFAHFSMIRDVVGYPRAHTGPAGVVPLGAPGAGRVRRPGGGRLDEGSPVRDRADAAGTARGLPVGRS
jgi:hypothetical protein